MVLERSQNSFYDFFTLKLAIFNCRCDKFSEIMCKKIINALNLYNPSEGLYKLYGTEFKCKKIIKNRDPLRQGNPTLHGRRPIHIAAVIKS